jgi:hypothetical protein
VALDNGQAIPLSQVASVQYALNRRLSGGATYPLLKQTLTTEHIKPRLLGHWGTTPGLNFIYVHLNRVIKQHDLNMIYITGPGYGGPGLVANGYLEGTYSEVYPNISPDEEGMKRLFTQFSFPGGIPSHVAPRDTRLDSRRGRTRLLQKIFEIRDGWEWFCRSSTSTATRSPIPASWLESAATSWTIYSAAVAKPPTSSRGMSRKLRTS